MWRLLLLPLGLAIAGLAAWLWLVGPPGEPMGEIDDASRERLERVLESEEATP